jgi:sugar lactone lactonase YvrE
MTPEARLIVDCRCGTGEGVIWHHLRQEVFWFDIPGKMLYSAKPDGSGVKARPWDRMPSAAGIIDRDTLVVAAQGGIFRYDLTTDSKTLLVPLELELPGNRSNDGRVNPAGGLWIGTMAHAEEGGVYSGSVYQYRAGALKKLFSDIRIPNSTCFSPDGRTAYFTDTPNKIIMKRPIDPATGEPAGLWSVFAETGDDPGAPDGAVIDSEGFLGSARGGGHRVIRYAPDGHKDREIMVPASQVACPGFGGPDLKTLYITTARKNLDAAALAKEPAAGGLFAIEVDVAGQPETLVQP